jgi:hypothetical protein
LSRVGQWLERLSRTGEILSKADDRLLRAEELLRPDERLKTAAKSAAKGW